MNHFRNSGAPSQLPESVREEQKSEDALSSRIEEVIASLEQSKHAAESVSSYQEDEMASLGGSKEELHQLIAEIHAEASEMFEESIQDIEQIKASSLKTRESETESVLSDETQKESLEEFEHKNLLRELDDVDWALERFSHENTGFLIDAVGKDSFVTSYNSDYVKVLSGSLYNEIMHEVDISRSYAYNKSINFAQESPERKEELREIAREVGDRLHRIAQRRGLSSLGLGNRSVTLSPENDGSVSLLLSLSSGNAYRGIQEGEKKTVEQLKGDMISNLQKKKKDLEESLL